MILVTSRTHACVCSRATHPADRQRLAEVRHAELRQAAAILGVTHLYPLGYHDSGMHGWETNTEPQAFAQAKVEDVAGQLVLIMRQHRPDVVVTYDEHGGYGHPDHIMAHRVTMAALAAAADATHFPEAGTPWQVRKVYYTAWARSDALRALKMMHLLGQKTSLRDPDFDPHSIGCPDELITTRVQCAPGATGEMAGPVRTPESDASVGFLLVVCATHRTLVVPVRIVSLCATARYPCKGQNQTSLPDFEPPPFCPRQHNNIAPPVTSMV